MAAFSTDEHNLVILDADHPGFRDTEYRARRNDIAKAALAYRQGDVVPDAHYTEPEHEVWRTVWRHLSPLHERFACAAYVDALGRLEMSREHIPQLRQINAQLLPRTGFHMSPVAGLVSARRFLSSLRDKVFLSTQYIRHHSVPLYTPEPDIVHELVGHAATFIHPEFVELNLAFGHAAARVAEEHLVALERVYWYTIEFGVVQEGGELKAYGAGLLSSFGELARLGTQEPNMMPLHFDTVAATPYDPTQYQPTLFVSPSFETMKHDVLNWLAGL
jgi:phenylalanine-4-hydroxylase